MIEKNNSKFIGMFLSVSLFFTGCTTVQLVSNYDETVDKQSQELQKKLDSYFISLQNLRGEPLTYKENLKFYEGVLTDLNALELRSSIIYKNKITQQEVVLLKDSIALLVLMHKNCIDGNNKLTDEQLKLVHENGIDLSLDCQKRFGAKNDLMNRAEEKINPYTIFPIQSGVNQHLGAIMKLELEKKRGEKDNQPTK